MPEPRLQRKDSADVALRLMEAADIAPLCRLARAIWRAHYPGIISVAQVEYMLERYYSEEAIAAQLALGAPTHILAWRGGELAGFITSRKESETGWFIDKFYVDPALHGQGIGQALLRHVEDSAAAGGTLRLQVNRHNTPSIAYYHKRGFVIEGTLDTPFGPYVLEDYVMGKKK